jgi:hypothetical protein
MDSMKSSIKMALDNVTPALKNVETAQLVPLLAPLAILPKIELVDTTVLLILPVSAYLDIMPLPMAHVFKVIAKPINIVVNVKLIFHFVSNA